MANSASMPASSVDIRLMNAAATFLLALGTLLLVGMTLVWVANWSVFKLSSIEVEGELMHNSALTIRANAVPKLAGSFFTVNLGAAQRAFDSVPWVRQAVVTRVWPNQLIVKLEEHRPVALWANSGSGDSSSESTDKLVNNYGEVFEANLGDVEDDDLPILRGPEGSSTQVLTMLVKLQAELAAPMQSRIEVLELSGRGSWRAEMVSGTEIELGRGSLDEVVARTRRFVSTLPQVTQHYPEHPLLNADLRHNQGYALRLKGISTTAFATKLPTQK
jgi:cell division protein FtsQ